MNTFLHWTGIIALVGAGWFAAGIIAAILNHRAHDRLQAKRYARARAATPPAPGPALTAMPPGPKLYPVRTTRPMRYGRCGCISMPCAAHLACGDMEEIARREMGDGR